jgi:ring-1,2-phenylacetyl-CoA epoxidase subunit PaaD
VVTATLPELRALAAAVLDPELPVLTIEDLGILRDVRIEGERVVVTITPTYSGCPAVEAIRADVAAALAAGGVTDVEIRTVLSPAWTTDWLSADGARKLAEYGIAPPGPAGSGAVALVLSVRCPQCGSPDTRETSRFSSTACKALYTCRSCKEPFEHMKAI